jgi:hypothetical protein
VLTTVTVVDWMPLGAAVSVAVTLHVPAVAGAVYWPVPAPIEPHVAAHVTAVVAENCTVPFTATLGFAGEMENPAAPERDTACGLFDAESVNIRLADRAPFAEGVNVTLTVQLAPTARLVPQVLAEMVKSPALDPEIAMLVMDIAVLAPFVSVTVCAAVVEPTAFDAKVRFPGVTLAPAAVPVPDRATLCGLLEAESVNVNAADRAPVAAGVNVTLTVQLPEPGTLVPHVWFDIAKSAALAPVIAMLLKLTAVLPPFVRVTVCAELVELTVVDAYVRLPGVTFAPAGLPVPDSPTV